MPDTVNMIPLDAQAAFASLGDTPRFFMADARMIAAECREFTAAPWTYLPETGAQLIQTHNGRGEWLAQQAFLAAWSSGVSRSGAQEFADLVGYIAGLTFVEEHVKAGNTDRAFVEAASWAVEDAFHASFAMLMASGAIDTSRTVN